MLFFFVSTTSTFNPFLLLGFWRGMTSLRSTATGRDPTCTIMSDGVRYTAFGSLDPPFVSPGEGHGQQIGSCIVEARWLKTIRSWISNSIFGPYLYCSSTYLRRTAGNPLQVNSMPRTPLQLGKWRSNQNSIQASPLMARHIRRQQVCRCRSCSWMRQRRGRDTRPSTHGLHPRDPWGFCPSKDPWYR